MKGTVTLIHFYRLVNLPVEPVPSLHKMLAEDWEWAMKEKNPGFGVDYLLYITKMAIDTSIAAKQTKKKKGEDESKIYYKFEDTLLEENAEHIIVFNSKIAVQFAGATNPTEYTMKSNLQYQKVIMIIPFKKYLAIVPQLPALSATA